MGQTRRFRDVRGMSGPPQKADISGPGPHFAFVPLRDITSGRARIHLRRPIARFQNPDMATASELRLCEMPAGLQKAAKILVWQSREP
jgi:hypothetical protein